MSAGTLNPSFAAEAPAKSSGTRWIISRQDDLVWFVGTALAGYLALGLLSAGVSLTLLTAVWLVGVDGPQVFGTLTRTCFDQQERRRLGWRLWASLPMLFIGPLAVYSKQGALFYLIAVCWLQYHNTTQQMGFVRQWKARNREQDAFDIKLDRWFLLASGLCPLALLVIKTRPPSILGSLLATDIVATYPILVVIFAIYQLRKWRAGKPMNPPKLLFMAVLVPLQWLAYGYAARFGPDGIVRAGIALGLVHSLQYQRLMWFLNKNEKHASAAVPARKFGYYLIAAAGSYVVAELVPQTVFPADRLVAALLGIVFMRYVLDRKIWRDREHKELAAALHL